MTPEQRYLFDTVEYFSLKNALSSEELQRVQEAADRYILHAAENCVFSSVWR